MTTETATAVGSEIGLKNEDELRQELEVLQQEAARLSELRIRLDSDLSRAKEERQQLEAELEAEFGTKDPERIKQILQERVRSNNEAVALYRQAIQKMREELEFLAAELAKLK